MSRLSPHLHPLPPPLFLLWIHLLHHATSTAPASSLEVSSLLHLSPSIFYPGPQAHPWLTINYHLLAVVSLQLRLTGWMTDWLWPTDLLTNQLCLTDWLTYYALLTEWLTDPICPTDWLSDWSFPIDLLTCWLRLAVWLPDSWRVSSFGRRQPP